MSKPKIAIVVGSTRAARFADVPTQWIAKIAKSHADIDVEVVDLRDFPLPFFDEVASSPGRRRRTKSHSTGREGRRARWLHLHRRRIQPWPDRRAEERDRLRCQ